MQISTGKTEGYIEEIMNGEKVVKVFNHEEKSKEEFDVLNEKLCNDATKAQYYGNILMPILNNFGNIVYIIIAGIGFVLSYFNVYNLSIQALVDPTKTTITIAIVTSFLGMSKQFSQSISQVSQQISMVAMAMAGAQRCFDLIEQEKEEDNGYVTLVRCYIDDKGNRITLTEEIEVLK